MFYSLNGTLTYINPTFCVIECGGVGYKCTASFNTLRDIGVKGEVVEIYTHLSVREDNWELFGFSKMEELDCFRMLINISGVGPKAAISILSELTPQKLIMCIASNDTKSLTKAQGIGNKIAIRIVTELKDKVKNLSVSNEEINFVGQLPIVTNENASKALSALKGLGFSENDVMPILSKLDATLSVEQLISTTLKEKGKR